MLASFRRMPTCAWPAISLSVLDTPPRVGSRSTCTCSPAAARTPATRSCSGAESLSQCRLELQPFAHRHDGDAMRGDRAVDQHHVAGRTRARRDVDARRDHADARRVDEDAVPLAPVDHLRVAGDDRHAHGLRRSRLSERTMRHSSSIGRPSSRMNPAESASGRAPHMARSLTVPCTASEPMSPPGKKSGLTTNESVEKARRDPAPAGRRAGQANPRPRRRAAPPGRVAEGRHETCARSASASSRPPPPCASVTVG